MTSRDPATEAQVIAADPRASTWLSANAGSGKTRVLTERVARLLLAGTPPQNILCLTYTKAAAGEMQNRLFKTLGAWAMKSDPLLSDALAKIGTERNVDLAEARTLFARAIETPGGLKIQTIHSFCAALLRRFPLEAGVSPGFTEMDEGAQRHLLTDLAEQLASDDADGAFSSFIGQAGIEGFDRLLTEFAGKRALFKEGVDRAEILASLGFSSALNSQSILHELDPNPGLLSEITSLLRTGSSNDLKAHEKLAALNFQEITLADLIILEDVFLSKSNKDEEKSFRAKIGRFPTAKLIKEMEPTTLSDLNDLMVRSEEARRQRMALEAAERTLAMHRFARLLLPAYEAEKLRRGWLDFDDLIERAAALLSDREAAQWVLFRLDGGIDHILVDESQDTSPEQWRIIELLTGEFGAGEGSRAGTDRTLFVVGDKKQSIYSFQGADAEAFDRMKSVFGERLAVEGGLQTRELLHSFRSASAILDVVDKTFTGDAARGVGSSVRHIAYHDDRPGRVDLWPLVERQDADEDRPWDDPVDKPSPEAPSAQLARWIAQEIATMINDPGATVEDGDGPRRLRPGDFLVLVRGRSAQGDLFQTLIRAIKAKGIPVAGADVIKLEHEMAAKDLRALLAFLALTEDDLSLACALRSPLFGLSEDDLYGIAAGREDGVTLWQALRTSDTHPETIAILQDLLDKTDFLRPYELLERMLVRHEGRRKILARLGAEAEDGIDVLLNRALAYEQKHTPSLTGFLAWLDGETVEVKRAMDQAGGTVRVMTVHGAKGLEAPVVILPDTMRADRPRPTQILSDEAQRPYWSVSRDRMPDTLKSAADASNRRNTEELQRLLYVAMTRAESWLIVCGFEQGRDPGRTWYHNVKAGLEVCGAETLETHFGAGLRYESGRPMARLEAEHADSTSKGIDLPAWAGRDAPEPDRPDAPKSPSDLGGAKALPGEGAAEEEALRHGRQVHKLLEHLPGYEPGGRADIAAKLLSFGEDAAPEQEARTMGQEVSDLIERPDLDWIFASDTLAEVDVSAVLPELANQRILGVIDRLVVTDDTVTIVDFKSNRIVPHHEQEVPAGVLRQMGAYLCAIRQIYPDREIRLMILWVSNGSLMTLSHDIVMVALKGTATS